MPCKPSLGLGYSDIRKMEHAFHVAGRSGYPLNVFVTYAPPRELVGRERARAISTYRGHLSQALQRGGYDCHALFVRECKAKDEREAGEHLHALIHAPDRKAFAIIQRVHGERVRAEWNRTDMGGDYGRLLYVCKERTGPCEGLMKKNLRPSYPREIAAQINGRRWSLSRPLLGLVKRKTPGFSYLQKRPSVSQKPVLTLIIGGQMTGSQTLWRGFGRNRKAA